MAFLQDGALDEAERQLLEGLRLRFGVNNLLDEAPPLVDESLGYSTQYHSLKGREYYLQIRANF